MSTGEKLIRATQWQPGDGTASNAAPGYGVLAGSQTNKVQIPVLQFDGAGSTVEYAIYTTRVPVDYAAGGTFKILWMANSTSGTVKWQARVAAVTPSDVDTPLEHAWGTEATASPSVNATEARRLIETSITLNMDSAAAGDEISFLLSRDPGNDTCTADAELVSVAWQYTADDQAGSPLGYIDRKVVTSDQGSITNAVVVVLTGTTATWTALANRRYRITGGASFSSTTAADEVWLYLVDGSDAVKDTRYLNLPLVGVAQSTAAVDEVITPGAGSVTRKLAAVRAAGSGTITMNASATSPTWLYVEDIGSSV